MLYPAPSSATAATGGLAARSALVGKRTLSFGADIGALALLWLLILVFFWHLVTPDVAARQYYVTGDFTWKEQAQDIVTARDWAEGRLPLWNPYIYGGQPIAADPGVGIYYPMALLFNGTADGSDVTLLRLEWHVVVDFWLTGTLAYLFFRAVGGSPLPALGGTLLYTFSSYLTSYPPHQLDILETGTWLPLALLAVRRVCGPSKPSSTRRHLWALVGGVALGLTFLSGHPQTALLVVLATAAYALYLTLRHGTWRIALPDAALAVLAGLGLGAAQLVPSIEMFPLSNHTSVPEAIARLGIPLSALPGFVLPSYAGQAALYVGVGGAALALLGVWANRKGDGWFWLALALGALVVSLGGQTPAYEIFRHLGFSLIRDQSRAIFLTSFAAATLATLGLANLPRLRRYRPWCLLLAVASCLVPLLGPALRRHGDSLAADAPRLPIALCVALVALVALGAVLPAVLGRLTARPKQSLGQARHAPSPTLSPESGGEELGCTVGMPLASHLSLLALILLLAVEGMAVNWNNNVTSQPPAVSDGLPSTVSYLRSLPQPFRIATDGDQIVPANDWGKYSLATDQGYNDYRVGAINDLLTSGQLWRAWQLLDVHEFVTARTFGPPYTLQHSEHSIQTYSIGYMLPAAWAVWQYRVVPDMAASLQATLASSFDPGQSVILDRPPNMAIPTLPQHMQRVSIEQPRPEEAIITATVDQPAVLVWSEAYFPGWTATVDGRSAPLLRADHALQAVAIPAGHHTVVFTFDPWSVKIGIALSALTLLGLVAGFGALTWIAGRERPTLVSAGHADRGRSLPALD